MVSSYPHAWLRVIYRRVAGPKALAHLAPVYKYQRLMNAAECPNQKQPGCAQLRRRKQVSLGHLARMEARRPPDPSEEL